MWYWCYLVATVAGLLALMVHQPRSALRVVAAALLVVVSVSVAFFGGAKAVDENQIDPQVAYDMAFNDIEKVCTQIGADPESLDVTVGDIQFRDCGPAP